jgi:hypothetical protein
VCDENLRGELEVLPMLMRRAALIVCFGLNSLGWTQPSQPSLLNYAITGWSSSNSPAENATYAMEHREVQRLLLDIATEPRAPQYVQKALEGSGVTVSDMVKNGSLRLEGGRYWLNFSLLTRADQEIMRNVAEKYSDSLSAALLKRRGEMEKLLATYDGVGVDRREVAFIVVGCVALDWGGLNLTTAKGYRAAPPKRKNGEFFFMAEEIGGPSLKEIYWGSNSNNNGRYGFLTFGDHYSGRVNLQPLVSDGEKIGPMMFALRDGPKTAEQLATAARTDRSIADSMLNRLAEIGWVDRQGQLYASGIPVLTARDKDMVSGLLMLSDQVMTAWLSENYTQIRRELSEITPLRQKVPYDQTFDQVWHYLFGTTNRKLVRVGLFADPYAAGRARPGYVSAIYDATALALPDF